MLSFRRNHFLLATCIVTLALTTSVQSTKVSFPPTSAVGKKQAFLVEKKGDFDARVAAVSVRYV